MRCSTQHLLLSVLPNTGEDKVCPHLLGHWLLAPISGGCVQFFLLHVALIRPECCPKRRKYNGFRQLQRTVAPTPLWQKRAFGKHIRGPLNSQQKQRFLTSLVHHCTYLYCQSLRQPNKECFSSKILSVVLCLSTKNRCFDLARAVSQRREEHASPGYIALPLPLIGHTTFPSLSTYSVAFVSQTKSISYFFQIPDDHSRFSRLFHFLKCKCIERCPRHPGLGHRQWYIKCPYIWPAYTLL